MGSKNDRRGPSGSKRDTVAAKPVASSTTIAQSENMTNATNEQQQETGADAGQTLQQENSDGKEQVGAGSAGGSQQSLGGEADGTASGQSGEAPGGVDGAVTASTGSPVGGEGVSEGTGDAPNGSVAGSGDAASQSSGDVPTDGSNGGQEQQSIGASDVGDLGSVLGDTRTFDTSASATSQPGETNGPVGDGVKPIENDNHEASSNDPAAAAAVATTAAAPAQSTAEAADEVTAQDVLDAAIAQVTSTTAKLALQNMRAYVDAMDPRRMMDEHEGARHQVSLYRALTGAINSTEGDDFTIVFTAMLRALMVGSRKTTDVFHDVNAFRFTEHLSLPAENRKTFRNVLYFMKAIADPRGRKLALKQVQFDRVFEQQDIQRAGVERIKQFLEV